MENFIEQTINIKLVLSAIFKPLMYLAIAFGFYPAYDFVVPHIVPATIFLDPWWKEFLAELKELLGVLISIFVLIKVILGVNKLVKEKK